MGAPLQLHGPAYEWALWSTTVRVVTADPHALPSARRLVDQELAHVELAASPYRRDAEIATLPTGRRHRISATLTAILAAALRAAEETDGAVDPTRARPLRAVGEGDLWRGIEIDEQAQTVLIPGGVELDLDSMTRALATDRCAAVVADVLNVGVLVSLGGDIATAGPAGGGAWEVLVGGPDAGPEARGGGSPAAIVAVPTGLAVVTATSRAHPDFRAATVVAEDCVTAATWSEAVLGDAVHGYNRLVARGLPARLVAAGGILTYVGGWPEDAEIVR
jgi:FAD:protein FMN transferase